MIDFLIILLFGNIDYDTKIVEHKVEYKLEQFNLEDFFRENLKDILNDYEINSIIN